MFEHTHAVHGRAGAGIAGVCGYLPLEPPNLLGIKSQQSETAVGYGSSPRITPRYPHHGRSSRPPLHLVVLVGPTGHNPVPVVEAPANALKPLPQLRCVDLAACTALRQQQLAEFRHVLPSSPALQSRAPYIACPSLGRLPNGQRAHAPRFAQGPYPAPVPYCAPGRASPSQISGSRTTRDHCP